MSVAALLLDDHRPVAIRANDLRIGGFSFLAGPAEPIDAWCERVGLGTDTARQLSQAGLQSIAQSPDEVGVALIDCMNMALAQAHLRAEDISAICFVPPSFDWSRESEAELFQALAASEFGRVPVVGVGLQGCGAIGAAVEVASGLALRRNGPVLIVLSALARGGASFEARSLRLFGCGVACAVLAPGAGPYRVLGTSATSDMGLALAGLRDERTPPFQDSWQMLRAALADLMASAGTSAEDIAFVCGSNVNRQALMAIAMAAGVPGARVWAGGLTELGHLYSADALISLAFLERSGRLRPGDRVLVVSWSEWVIGGIILEYRP